MPEKDFMDFVRLAKEGLLKAVTFEPLAVSNLVHTLMEQVEPRIAELLEANNRDRERYRALKKSYDELKAKHGRVLIPVCDAYPNADDHPLGVIIYSYDYAEFAIGSWLQEHGEWYIPPDTTWKSEVVDSWCPLPERNN
ncbi:MAG TPA: hypothetical protein ENI27_05105 [bacterium]|nr:hypothetical protein [bacterium]